MEEFEDILKRKLEALKNKIERQKNKKMIKENDESKGYGISNCEICKGVGFIISKDKKNRTCSRHCDCFNKRWSMEQFKKSEIGNKNDYTFENYKLDEEWQKDIYQMANEYVKNYKDNWFYIGGQVGAGKTHICTAILRNIGDIENITFKYIKCDEELELLKQEAFDENNKYMTRLNNLKTIGLLYIDDFFKKEPSKADIAKIFDIINYRYVNNKNCIFSSEHMLYEILNIDEAIGSRIFEKAKNFKIDVDKDPTKNFRLK